MIIESMTNNNFLATDTGDYHLLVVSGRNSELAKEAMEGFSNLPWFVLLDCMAYLIYNNELELALHLSNSQLFVHPITAC